MVFNKMLKEGALKHDGFYHSKIVSHKTNRFRVF